MLNITEDDDDTVVNDDLTRGDEDTIESDAPDPFCGVYANVPKEGHVLKPVDNCEFCNAKKFEYEPPGFCCRSGAINLSTPEMPPDELVRLWTASDSDGNTTIQKNNHLSCTKRESWRFRRGPRTSNSPPADPGTETEVIRTEHFPSTGEPE
jgi:hypothetical protein